MTIVAELGRITENLIAILLLTFLSHLVAGSTNVIAITSGLLLLFVFVLFGFILARIIPGKLPDIFWISIVPTVAGLPLTPGSEMVIGTLSELSIVATMTPVLAFAALGLTGKDIALFRQAGFQFVILSILVFTGTFLGSAVVAQLVLLTL